MQSKNIRRVAAGALLAVLTWMQYRQGLHDAEGWMVAQARDRDPAIVDGQGVGGDRHRDRRRAALGRQGREVDGARERDHDAIAGLDQ